ncbi:unnamed protein product [Rhodiola kirilowii]
MKLHVPEEHRKDIKVKLVCGSVAGLLGQTFTYPLDVVRRQMQVEHLSATNNTELKGTMESLVMILRRHGWKTVIFWAEHQLLEGCAVSCYWFHSI